MLDALKRCKCHAEASHLLCHSLRIAGSIITVEPDEAKALGPPWTRRYVYNQGTCGRCRGGVRTWDMAGRTVYACEVRPGHNADRKTCGLVTFKF